MIIYLTCISCLITYYIFNSKGIDYRAVALGSLLPFIIDLVIGKPSFGHSFLFPVLALVLVMLLTIGRSRLLRRRMLCVVIGIFFALILQFTFLHEQTWWWPTNFNTQDGQVDLYPSVGIWILRDIVGLIAGYILFAIGELHIKENRDRFIKTGRLSK